MIDRLEISTLSNSIRFYNSIFGLKPDAIDYEQAKYTFGKVALDLVEKTGQIAPLRFNLVVRSQRRFWAVYQRMRSFVRSIPQDPCELLRDRFKVSDPDGHTWLISRKPLSGPEVEALLADSSCMLEPVNY